MINTTFETPAELTEEAIEILCREMGVVKTIRFLQQFSNGYGDYTKERENLFKDLTVADVVAEIEKSRKID